MQMPCCGEEENEQQMSGTASPLREERRYERVPASPTMADDGAQGGARK